MTDGFAHLLQSIRDCRVCASHLPYAPNPIVRLHADARILLIGQAPGTKVHATGIPWNDQSGDKLRAWLGVDRDTFYNEKLFAIMPMGFCYPGKGSSSDLAVAHGGARANRRHGWRSGDLPPRHECAPLWHLRVRSMLPNLRLTLLIGSYAVRHCLPHSAKLQVRDVLLKADFKRAVYLPLVHPSPRNKLWLKQNPWFEADVVPQLKRRISDYLPAN